MLIRAASSSILEVFSLIIGEVKMAYLNNFDIYHGQGRKAEEQRAQRLVAEMGQYRHEMEKRLQEKDEELEGLR